MAKLKKEAEGEEIQVMYRRDISSLSTAGARTCAFMETHWGAVCGNHI